MKINLCFITDDGYAMPTCVTISSIKQNKNINNLYNIYILCKNVSEEKKNKFMELSSDDFYIKNIDVEEKEDYSKYKIEGIPATPTAMYKFFIPEILKDEDRVLYLDGDIIVQKDLEKLYNIDIGDKYLGAVKDTNGLDHEYFGKYNYGYFNSGVMIMNLRKMREDKVSDKLIEYRKTGFNKLMDQDTFNYVFKDSKFLLSFEYNTQMNTLSSELMKNKKYTVENFKKYWEIPNELNSIKEIYENATILHYTTAKPWKYYDGYGNDLWLKYYLESPYGSEFIYRESYFINKIVNSSIYKIGKKAIFLPVKIKKLFSNKKIKRYNKFLTTFLNN